MSVGSNSNNKLCDKLYYRPAIASAAVRTKNFHDASVQAAGYSLSRMTWIKTNFLWMMYRSGWATKPGQERILVIRLSRHGFEQILEEATCRGEGDVRLQWDPDHLPSGLKAPGGRRAIQLGLRGKMAERFSREFITDIDDITDLVRALASNCSSSSSAGWDALFTPVEKVYVCGEKAASQIFYSDDDTTSSSHE